MNSSFYYGLGPEYLLPPARPAVYLWPPAVLQQRYIERSVKAVSNSKATTKELKGGIITI